jgi:hypothetical protein
LRSSTAPRESSPASISGASASTAPPAVRAAKVITVSSDTVADGAAAFDRAATANGRRVPKADKNGGATPPPSIVPHETGIIATTGGAPAPTASPSAASPSARPTRPHP